MKIRCAISNFEFTVPYFSLTLTHLHHPIFHVPQRTLLAQIKPLMQGRLEDPEQVLLFLALVHSTGTIQWNDPFHIDNASTDIALIEGNMHKVLNVVYKLNELSVCQTFEIPRFVASRHSTTNTIKGLLGAVEAWELAIDDFVHRKGSVDEAQRLLRIEQTLERLLRMQRSKPEAFAKTLSNWAAVAAEFPQYSIIRGHTQWLCTDYWQGLIRRCVLGIKLVEIPTDDLIDLIEYCEEEIPHGSIYAATLMSILRGSIKKQREYLGLPAHKGIRVFSIVPASEDEKAQHANDVAKLKQMALVAPDAKPKRDEYLQAFLFLRALSRWEAKQTLDAMEADKPGSTDVSTADGTVVPLMYPKEYGEDI